MGQYYRVYTKNKKGKETIYNRTVDGKYTRAKLTEHSWWLNPFVNTICHKIHHKPLIIAWVGDYAEGEIHDIVWDKTVKTSYITEAQVVLYEKYLVNHTKKTYLDCDKYYEKCSDKYKWCLHPLPLLTAIGNGSNGGDYHGINQDKIGIWAMDSISVEEKIPKGYTEFFIEFKE